MDAPTLTLLQDIVEKNDINALDKLLKPRKRIQNKAQNFKSALMLSGHQLKHLLKLDSINSDCIMLNLEDGVSYEKKPLALRLVAYFLSQHDSCSKKLVVRVNALDEGGLDEIRFLNAYAPDAIRVPKICSVKDVEKVLEVLDDNIELHLSIETKSGFSNIKTLQNKRRVKALYLGVLDLLADLGLDQSIIDVDNPTIHYILSEFLIASKIIGAHPVSFVYQDYKNMNEFKAWLELERKMGFLAKGCVSPAQADEAMKVFTLKDEHLRRAHAIVERFEKMQKQGVTGFADDEYGFIDEPIYKGALKTLSDC